MYIPIASRKTVHFISSHSFVNSHIHSLYNNAYIQCEINTLNNAIQISRRIEAAKFICDRTQQKIELLIWKAENALIAWLKVN